MKAYNKLFETKLEELRQREMHLKSADCQSTDNTKSSQLNKVRREAKTLKLIRELVVLLPEDAKLSEFASSHLNNILTLVAERQSAIHFECHAGDKVIDLLQKYNTMNKLMVRMATFCEKHNLAVNWEKGVIELKAPVKPKASNK